MKGQFLGSIIFLISMLVAPVLAQDSTNTAVTVADTVVQQVMDIPAVQESTAPTFLDKLLAEPGLPFVVVLVAFLILFFFFYDWFANALHFSRPKDEKSEAGMLYRLNEMRSEAAATRNVMKYLIILVTLGYLLYVAVKGTPMQGFVMEWLNLLVRWFHVVAGIMWIGASFYFIFLENNLNRIHNVRDELAGNLWAIHGGGFYFLEKYKVAPKEIPKELHWFKYEAYFTWLSGFALLFIVYYMDAKAFLIDPSVADISVPLAIGIGIATLIFGWVVYDAMCKSPLIKKPFWFAAVGLVLLIGVAYFLTHVFSGRAAYIHVGALIGTIMAWNVYFVIIPSQKALVKAAVTGQPLDATLGQKAGQRSLHNNYFTLPVIFIMISNHFPSTFGHEFNWVVLTIISLASAGIKHYWNLIERKVVKTYILVLSIIALILLIVGTSPLMDTVEEAEPVSFSQANIIIQTRCVQCHSANPTDEAWPAAPNGVMYDTPEQIKSMADKILVRAVKTNTMPQGNKTGMTEEERKILGNWILQGATLEEVE